MTSFMDFGVNLIHDKTHLVQSIFNPLSPNTHFLDKQQVCACANAYINAPASEAFV